MNSKRKLKALTYAEKLKAIEAVKWEQCSNTDDVIFSSLFNIENIIDVESVNCLKQKKITDFFV